MQVMTMSIVYFYVSIYKNCKTGGGYWGMALLNSTQ